MDTFDEYNQLRDNLTEKERLKHYVSSTTGRVKFSYIDHRTTRHGSVALDFEIHGSEYTGTAFFRVNLISSHGNIYSAGHKGQFSPPERGKFRKFYMDATGNPPSRWCRVHQMLRKKFTGVIFSGFIEVAKDRNDVLYIRIKDLRVEQTPHISGTEHPQPSHIYNTSQAQGFGTLERFRVK